MNPMSAASQNDLASLTDHDLLITLISEVKALREDIARVGDTTATKLGDHEARLRSLEQKIWIWTGASGIIGAAASFAANHLIK